MTYGGWTRRSDKNWPEYISNSIVLLMFFPFEDKLLNTIYPIVEILFFKSSMNASQRLVAILLSHFRIQDRERFCFTLLIENFVIPVPCVGKSQRNMSMQIFYNFMSNVFRGALFSLWLFAYLKYPRNRNRRTKLKKQNIFPIEHTHIRRFCAVFFDRKSSFFQNLPFCLIRADGGKDANAYVFFCKIWFSMIFQFNFIAHNKPSFQLLLFFSFWIHLNLIVFWCALDVLSVHIKVHVFKLIFEEPKY